MKKIPLNEFSKGFISPYDIDTRKVTPNALADILNCEINTPMMALSRTPGYTTEISPPSYSGNKIVAIKKWGVERPSNNEITVLVKSSDNMLLMSENFHIDYIKGGASGPRAWQFTDGTGGTITQNQTDGPVRRAYKILKGSLATYLRQNFACVSGVTYCFSIYLNTDTDNSVIIAINDSSTTTTSTIGDGGTGWQRFEVTKTAGATGTGYVEIKIDNGATTATYIWGAQLETGSGASEYGYTFLSPKPYYVYMYPYYSAGTWTNGWLELTEMRCFTMNTYTTNVFTPTGGNIRTTGEGDNYFKRWYAQCIGNQASTGELIGNVGIVLGNDATTLGIVGGVSSEIFAPDANYHILVSRHPHINDTAAWTTYDTDTSIYPLCQYNINQNNITFYDTGFGLSISFFSTVNRTGVQVYPMIISYIKNQIGTSVSPYVAPVYDEFQLTYESPSLNAIGHSDPSYINPIVPDIIDGGVGTMTSQYYWLALVGIYSGIGAGNTPAGTEQKVYYGYDSVNLGSNRYLTIYASINAGLCDPRLIAVDVYMGTSATSTYPGDNAMYWQMKLDILNDAAGSERWKLFKDVTSAISTTTATLFANLQREKSLQTYNQYATQVYVAGRKYTANQTDTVRFSNIRDVVEEINIFPFDSASSFGEVIAYPGSSDYIVGLAKTSTNDLLIFKQKRMLVYEVQSGRGGMKRLYSAFDGIGCSTAKSICESPDYGTFWYDEQGIYRYVLGMPSPERIGLGKIQTYWARYLKSYIPYSFAFFNRKVNEYWIFIQVSGTAVLPTSGTASEWRVFRYSPIFQNWNISRFGFTPSSVTDKINGEIVIGSSTGIYKWGYDSAGTSYTTEMPNGIVQTHKLVATEGVDPNNINEIECEYDVANTFTVKAIINDESTARAGNARVFPSGRKTAARTTRAGSKARKVAFRLEFGAGSFALSSIYSDVIQLKERYEGAR